LTWGNGEGTTTSAVLHKGSWSIQDTDRFFRLSFRFQVPTGFGDASRPFQVPPLMKMGGNSHVVPTAGWTKWCSSCERHTCVAEEIQRSSSHWQYRMTCWARRQVPCLGERYNSTSFVEEELWCNVTATSRPSSDNQASARYLGRQILSCDRVSLTVIRARRYVTNCKSREASPAMSTGFARLSQSATRGYRIVPHTLFN